MKTLGLIFILAFAISCSQTENRSVPQGGQDSGGGNIIFSTDAEVQVTFEAVLTDLPRAVHEILDEGFLGGVLNDEKLYLLLTFKQKLIEFVPESERVNIDKEIDEAEIFDGKETPKPLLDAFKKVMDASKINIKKDGPCAAVGNPHAYASIKDHEVGSPICISFYKLKSVPRESLYKEMLAVLMHEYLHALKFDERSSVVIQSVISSNFAIVSDAYYSKVFIPVSSDLQKIELVEHANTLKRFALATSSIRSADLVKFCSVINETSLSRQLLYQKYSKAIEENKRAWIEKKIVNENVLRSIELSVALTNIGFRLDGRDELKPAFENCKVAKPIEPNAEFKNGLLKVYKEIYMAVDGMDEIDYYLENIY